MRQSFVVFFKVDYSVTHWKKLPENTNDNFTHNTGGSQADFFLTMRYSQLLKIYQKSL